MACKEVMVTAPLIVLLFERTFITGSFGQAIRKSWPLYAGLAAGWGLLLWLNCAAPRAETAGFHLEVSPIAWWLTQSKVLWMYLKLTVWPWPLAIHYEMPYLAAMPAAWPWLLSTLLLGITTLALLWRRSAIGFVGAWVLLILSPTMVVPIVTEVVAERRMYLPLAAIATLAIVGAFALAQYAAGEPVESAKKRKAVRQRPIAIVTGVALVLAIAFGLISVRRLEAYHDPASIWQDVLATNSDDATANNNLADALNEMGRSNEAIEYAQRALRLKPNYAKAQLNLGNALLDLGRANEAIEHYQQAVQIQPDFADAHVNLGMAMLATGRQQEAIAQYEQSIQLKPNNVEARYNLGNALLAAGKAQEAIESFEQALQLDPDNAEIHNNLGAALANAGRLQEAVVQFQETLRLQPDTAQLYFNLAKAYAKLQRAADAIGAAEKALALARSQQQAALAQQIESWLSSFRAPH
jgi:tetratricopeptide (TPR) repeat protein